MVGDEDSKKILDVLMGKSLTPYGILNKIDIPQATAYRKIKSLVNVWLLVENKKIYGEHGRPAIKLSTLYSGLDISITKNRITIRVKMRKTIKNISAIKKMK